MAMQQHMLLILICSVTRFAKPDVILQHRGFHPFHKLALQLVVSKPEVASYMRIWVFNKQVADLK